MLFNSIEFLFFLPLVIALYYAIPGRYRWVLLLAASFYFYAAWKLEYLFLMFVSILIDYFSALGMSRSDNPRRRKQYLMASLAGNLGILLGFKYFNFFSDSIRALFQPFNLFADMPYLNVLLPVGVSFYTFQSMSYTIDVYRNRMPAERHLGIFALYVSFFPQLVAGPIERATHLLPQFRDSHRFEYARVTSGLRLILWGFFKKVVIADQLALFVQQVYGSPGQWHGPSILLASYFFAFQIFCDFSAYTDIARGSARIMGFDIMENFNRPYLARSIREFWQRWHISLSTWFRDYVYIPLGGNRVLKWRWYYNLMVVFVVSGLWHGANWTFVAWGFLHGSYQIFSLMTRQWRDAIWQAIDQARSRAAALFSFGFRTPQLAAADGALGAGARTGTSAQTADAVLLAVRTDGLAAADPPAAGSAARSGTGVWTRLTRGMELREAVALLVTFHLVIFSWIFFRAASISDAFTLIGDLAAWGQGFRELSGGFDKFDFAPALLALLIMEAVHALQERYGRAAVSRRFLGLPAPVRWAAYWAIIMYMLLFGQFETAQQFIYFQF